MHMLRGMDRVQQWRLSGNVTILRDALVNAAMANPRMRSAKWDSKSEKLVAKTRWNFLAFFSVLPQKITARVDQRTPDFWDVTVCSETLQLLDYGKNAENLEVFARSICAAGFQLQSTTIRTSWSRRSRP